MTDIPEAGTIGGWLVCGSSIWANVLKSSEAFADGELTRRKDKSIKLPLIVGPVPPAPVVDLTESDVLNLLGYAEIRRVCGDKDMPISLLDLAERIAKAIGSEGLAAICADYKNQD